MKRRTPGVSVLRLNYPANEGSQTVWFGEARVVVKADAEPHAPSQLVTNEFICARLAMALGVPAPMGEAGLIDGRQRAWISAQIEYNGQEFPPADMSAALRERPYDVAAMAAFDIWVHNEDRHEGNVIYHPEVGLWAIDFEHALGAADSGNAEVLAGIKDASTRIWALDGLTLDAEHFRPWCARIKAFPKSGLDATLKEARNRDLLNAAEAKEIASFLTHRQVRIHELVSKSLKWKSDSGEEEACETTQPVLGT